MTELHPAQVRGSHGGGSWGVLARTRAPENLRLPIFVVAALAAGLLSQVGADEELHLPIFWPAAALLMVWFATTPHRRIGIDLTALAVLSGISGLAAGVGSVTALSMVTGAPIRVLVYLLVFTRLSPDTWGAGGQRPLETVRDLASLCAAVTAGVTAELGGALLFTTTLGEPSLEVSLLAAAGRAASMLSLGAVGLLAGGILATYGGSSRVALRATVRRMRAAVTSRRVAEFLGYTTVTAIVVIGGFWIRPVVPATFVVLLTTVLVAVRFSPLVACLHAFATWSAVFWLSVAGHGPIAATEDPVRRVLITQVFLVALSTTALVIALSRRERDVTIERLRESEDKAAALADDLHLVLSSLREGVAVLEKGGRVVHDNPALGRILGLRPFARGRVRDVDDYGLTHPDGRPLLLSEVPHVRVFAGEPEATVVVHQRRPEPDPVGSESGPGPGPVRVVEINAYPLPAVRPGELPRAAVMVRDVTQEHRERDALTSFAHVVAHDLRNPLTVVGAWAEQLLERVEEHGSVSAEDALLVSERIRSATARMRGFISDLLTYAMSRDQTPTPRALHVSDLVEEAMATRKPMDGREPEVTVTYDATVWADPLLAGEVFDNLIGNSLKYVADGVAPRVQVKARPRGDWVSIRISDNGIGIPEGERDRVFESFERLHSEYEGTGLGLGICKHIVEAHGGRIQVLDPIGDTGTLVEFTLPANQSAFEAATTRRLPV